MRKRFRNTRTWICENARFARRSPRRCTSSIAVGGSPVDELVDGRARVRHVPLLVLEHAGHDRAHDVPPGAFARAEVILQRAGDPFLEEVRVRAEVRDLEPHGVGAVALLDPERRGRMLADHLVEDRGSAHLFDPLAESLDRARVHAHMTVFVACMAYEIRSELGPGRAGHGEVVVDELGVLLAGSVQIEDPGVRRRIRHEIAMPPALR